MPVTLFRRTRILEVDDRLFIAPRFDVNAVLVLIVDRR